MEALARIVERPPASRESPVRDCKDKGQLQVEELDGGSVVTSLGYGTHLNLGSSLRRRWFVLNNHSSPLQLRSAGIHTAYELSSTHSGYVFKPDGIAECRARIVACEVRFLLFDVWGDYIRTLSATKLVDANLHVFLSDIGGWRAHRDDVLTLLAVVSFVARAKLPDGLVWSCTDRTIQGEVEQIKAKLAGEGLGSLHLGRDAAPDQTLLKP